MKLSSTALLALAISSITANAYADPASQDFVPTTLAGTSAQSEAKGFIDGASLGGTTRNWFSNEQRFRGSKFTYQKHGEARTDNYRTNWVQGTILNATSGFTQGTVGVSTEVAVYNALVLDRSKRDIKGGSNRTLADSDGDAVDQWSKLGLANVKFRVSNTTLTAGRQNFSSGIIDTIGNRALPSSFEGVSFNSEEFSNLSFQGGVFDRVSPRTEQSLSKFRTEYGNGRQETDKVNTLGVNYQPFKSLKTSLFAANVEDFWNQYYFGATHELGDSQTLSLTTGLNYYKTVDEGKKLMGKIDNDTYSLSFGLTHQAHSLTFSYQAVNGDEYFDYLHETNGIYLANSLTSDFNGPNEKSFQIAYGINMAEYGVPGLKFNVYSARGWGIDGTHYTGDGGRAGFAYNGIQAQDGEKHQEYGVGAAYAIQSGALKATTIRGTYVTHRASANQADGNLREFRLVTTIPFNIL
ncbi:OprD family porin [Pseudomonas sp. D8002]|jgi:outer membrane OprD family porin|uniref:OprD family porin n=1 Tax=Pseudomonas TaxID=286 RepID=UPI000272BD89|nr:MULTISPECIES: OprD family porin [Pseudomonas]MDP9059514.1 OprD family porin [Pseudomonadota bacterium]AUO25585.1 outer membrane porin, OprD family [Pseudomonas sp. NC02]EJF69310.1 outer membrane porin, OprD family protein [Pseudomonas sp. Ag1]MBT1267921.1 OprD family porin [Pseudomonas sp. VS38]MDE1911703.1 OprD family porin [Pseudomonas sp.]|eukprot:gene19301-29739_t